MPKPARIASAALAALAVLAAFTYVSAPVGAETVAYTCQSSGGPNGIPLGGPMAWNPDVSIAAPGSVAPGATVNFTATFSPGPPGGPVAAEGTASVSFSVSGGTPSSVSASGPASAPGGGAVSIPSFSGSVTAGASGAVVITLSGLSMSFPNPAFAVGTACGGPAVSKSVTISAGGPSSTTLPGGSTTTTKPGGSTTTTTTKPGGSTTTTTTTTTTPGATTSVVPTTVAPTTAPTTAPTATEAPLVQSSIVSNSASLSYNCVTSISGSTLGNANSNTTITISAPNKVNPGARFGVSMKMSPGPKNGPVPIAAGAMSPTARLGVSNASPSPMSMSGSANSSEIAPDALVPVPTMSATATATGPVGSKITYTPGTYVFSAPSLGDAVITCNPSADVAVLSTDIVAEPLAGGGGVAGTSGGGAVNGRGLASTGSSTGLVALIGALLLATGLVTLRSSKRLTNI